jgi:SAM-dependent methyltransferase
MNNLQDYVGMLSTAYRGGTNNHEQHNSNPLYWDVLLGDLKNNPEYWAGKTALDFGCGKGRNVTNMKTLVKWSRVDGVDISQNNIDYCISTHASQKSIVSSFTNSVESKFYKNNGLDLSDIPNDEYDFIMSTIVFQHLCVHELRIALKKEIYRVMKSGGVFFFQMGYGDMDFKGHTIAHNYYENAYEAANTNGHSDVRVSNPNQLIEDLTNIGFVNITYRIEQPWEDGIHPNWIYVRCEKP